MRELNFNLIIINKFNEERNLSFIGDIDIKLNLWRSNSYNINIFKIIQKKIK